MLKDSDKLLSGARASNSEITAEILSLCVEPQNKTKIMYKTNLSWATLQRYLSQLLSRGLLEIRHSQIKYATTSKGLKFIDKWKEIVELY
jgi:predicted transcriptional regulator